MYSTNHYLLMKRLKKKRLSNPQAYVPTFTTALMEQYPPKYTSKDNAEIGYKVWYALKRDGRLILTSPSQYFEWPCEGVIEERLFAFRNRDAAYLSCYYRDGQNLDKDRGYVGCVIGTLKMWGHVEETHAMHVFCATEVVVTSIFWTSRKEKKLAQEVAKVYGVPCVKQKIPYAEILPF